MVNIPNSVPTSAQLRAVISTQTEIAKLGLNLNGVMTLVAEQAQVITGSSGAAVELVEGDDMVYRAVAGIASNLLGLRLDKNKSLSGLCVIQAQSLYCEDIETDPRVDKEASRRVGIRSMVVVPLIHHGEPVGALKVFKPEVSAFTAGDMQILDLMSELIAASMFHAAKYGADELYRQATLDNLTGLANRALFFDRLHQDLAKAKRENHKLGVLMLDMDGLKPINDTYGHRAGDGAIKEIATRISGETREVDTVARLGGDEFSVVLPSVGSCQFALATAARIADRCGQPFTFEDRSLKVGASIGLAIYPDDGEQPDELIEYADQLMYQTKREKKSAV